MQFDAFGQPAPSWTTLSVDPGGDAGRARHGGARRAHVLDRARACSAPAAARAPFCRALAFLGALAAVMAVIQRAVAPRSVLFVIEPEARSANPFGAFVNRNHFAAWLLLVAAPVCGYCIARLRIHPDAATPLARNRSARS